MAKELLNIEELAYPVAEDIKQNWLQNSYAKTFADQFGFVIEYGERYRLSYRGEEVVVVYSLQAAKLISTIILNDIIMNKP